MKKNKFKSVTEMAKYDISQHIGGLKKVESENFQNNKDCYTIGGYYSTQKANNRNGDPDDCFLVGETIPYESYIHSTESLFSKETKWLNNQLGIHSINK